MIIKSYIFTNFGDLLGNGWRKVNYVKNIFDFWCKNPKIQLYGARRHDDSERIFKNVPFLFCFSWVTFFKSSYTQTS